MRLTPKPLTAEAFAPFGRVPSAADARVGINEGRGTRRDLATFGMREGRAVAAQTELVPSALPFRVAVLERHVHSDQLFVALGQAAALVVVAPSLLDGSPDIPGAAAFIAEPDTPFVYAAGTWHSPLAVLDRAGSFLMVMTETGTAADCEIVAVAGSLIVVAPGGDHGITGHTDHGLPR